MPLPHVLAVPLPDPVAALPSAERARRAVIGDDNAALDDARFFLRGALTVPLARGGGTAITWRAWVEVERKAYKRALGLWRDPRRVDQPPLTGTLVTALPGVADAAGAAVALDGAAPGQPLAIRALAGALFALQRDGVDLAAADALLAAALR